MFGYSLPGDGEGNWCYVDTVSVVNTVLWVR